MKLNQSIMYVFMIIHLQVSHMSVITREESISFGEMDFIHCNTEIVRMRGAGKVAFQMISIL